MLSFFLQHITHVLADNTNSNKIDNIFMIRSQDAKEAPTGHRFNMAKRTAFLSLWSWKTIHKQFIFVLFLIFWRLLYNNLISKDMILISDAWSVIFPCMLLLFNLILNWASWYINNIHYLLLLIPVTFSERLMSMWDFNKISKYAYYCSFKAFDL